MRGESVHYILTFHRLQIMWEVGGMTPLYFYISLFFSFLVLCLALTCDNYFSFLLTLKCQIYPQIARAPPGRKERA